MLAGSRPALQGALQQVLPAAALAASRLLHTAAPRLSLAAVQKLFKEMEGRWEEASWMVGWTRKGCPAHRSRSGPPHPASGNPGLACLLPARPPACLGSPSPARPLCSQEGAALGERGDGGGGRQSAGCVDAQSGRRRTVRRLVVGLVQLGACMLYQRNSCCYEP